MMDIDLDVILKLFPNVCDIHLSGILKLNQSVMQKILNIIQGSAVSTPGTPTSPIQTTSIPCTPSEEIAKKISNVSKINLKYMNVSDTMVNGLMHKFSNKFQQHAWK